MCSNRQLSPATQAGRALRDKTRDFPFYEWQQLKLPRLSWLLPQEQACREDPLKSKASIFCRCPALVLCHVGGWRAPVLRAVESPAHGQAHLRTLVVWVDMLAANCSLSSSGSPNLHPSRDSGRCAKPPACPQYRDRSWTLESFRWLVCTSGSSQPPRPIKILFKCCVSSPDPSGELAHLISVIGRCFHCSRAHPATELPRLLRETVP